MCVWAGSRIWEDAEKQARRALVREERERVEALRAAFSNADYLTAEVFGVQSYRYGVRSVRSSTASASKRVVG